MSTRLFAYPFRIFFLSAASFAVLVVPLWLAMLLGGLVMPTLFPALAWHQHEMLFGFLHAAIAGFLLTAVCNWTGTERLHGPGLVGLWSVWLAARLLLLFGGEAPHVLAHAVDLSFLPIVMIDAGRRIVAVRQWRQLVVMVVLGALWLAELAFHIEPAGAAAGGALLMALTLMLVIGGRITPAFSGNRLRLQGADPAVVRVVPALERFTLAAMAATLVAYFAGIAELMAAAALLAAAASAVRLGLWRGWRVRDEPLLWILHLSLAWIPVSLVLLAGAAAGWAAPTAWVHAGGAGAMAALILGVMSRVALGHTGRPLRLPPGMPAAFVMVLAGGAVRVLTALGGLPWREGLLASMVLWVLAYAMFLWRYAGVLVAPRVDGKPG